MCKNDLKFAFFFQTNFHSNLSPLQIAISESNSNLISHLTSQDLSHNKHLLRDGPNCNHPNQQGQDKQEGAHHLHKDDKQHEPQQHDHHRQGPATRNFSFTASKT